jgi:hypothetical protein
MEYLIDIFWDDEAEVWVATSEDVIGLTLESESIDILKYKLRLAIPEILSLNHQTTANSSVVFNIQHADLREPVYV